eukprot:2374736-Prymnesium_polylepis.2
MLSSRELHGDAARSPARCRPAYVSTQGDCCIARRPTRRWHAACGGVAGPSSSLWGGTGRSASGCRQALSIPWAFAGLHGARCTRRVGMRHLLHSSGSPS